MFFLIAMGVVMLRVLFLVLSLFGAIGPAFGGWSGGSGEDPMTDKKWQAASAPFNPLGLPMVLFKCWEGGELQLGIVVGRYDDSASYASVVTAKFRVDKQEPVDIRLIPSNLNGFLNLTMMSEVDPSIITLLKSILDAKKRVALSVGDAVFESDVRGTTKAIGPMFSTCGLKPSAEAPGEAAAAAKH